jgi:exodeoxyribonuclease-1
MAKQTWLIGEPQEYIFYSLVTTGSNPQVDYIVSCSLLRTDASFMAQSVPEVYHIRLPLYYLPRVDYCLQHKILPDWLLSHGQREIEFCHILIQYMTGEQCYIVGYHNLEKDDEFLRHLFYRNLYNPYRYSQRRLDLFFFMVAWYFLRSNSLVASHYNDLSDLISLAKNNGFIIQEQWPRAWYKVYAMQFLGQLMQQQQSRLFNFIRDTRTVQRVKKYINLIDPKPILWLMRQENTASLQVVIPLIADPQRHQVVWVYHLVDDTLDFNNISSTQLHQFIMKAKSGHIPLIFSRLALNKMPIILPMSALDTLDTIDTDIKSKWHIRYQALLPHIQTLQLALVKVVTQEYDTQHFDPPQDVDFLLYKGGFFSEHDRRIFKQIHQDYSKSLSYWAHQLQDTRGNELLRRFYGRNFPHLLDDEQAQSWRLFCLQRLSYPVSSIAYSFQTFYQQIGQMDQPNISPEHKKILHQLWQYARRLEKTLLKCPI